MRVYIAGAITDNPNYKAQFAAAEERLRAAGHEVFNPAKNQGYTYKEYIDMGLFELMRCEAIYLLKGYEYSTGATLEFDYAMTVGLLVITEEEDMKDEYKVGDVLLDKATGEKCVISSVTAEGDYIVTYGDGSGGNRNREMLNEWHNHTKETINIRSVLDELKDVHKPSERECVMPLVELPENMRDSIEAFRKVFGNVRE